MKVFSRFETRVSQKLASNFVFLLVILCLHAHRISFRDRDKSGKTLTTKMPSAPTHTAEEAHLLG